MIVKSYFETVVASSIVVLLSSLSLKTGKAYLDEVRKTVIEAEIKECVEELNCRNLFKESASYKCPVSSAKDSIYLFFDKKRYVVYSYEKIFHFGFGKDISCQVKDNQTLCFFR